MWIDATVAGGMLEISKQSKVVGKIGYAPAPIAATPNGSHWLWSWAFGMPKSAKQPEAAEKFAAWATSKEYIALVAADEGWGFGTSWHPEIDFRQSGLSEGGAVCSNDSPGHADCGPD